MLRSPVSSVRRITDALGLREGEAARTARLFVFIFLMTASIVLGKSAQRGIFLAAYPRSAIPDAFLLSAAVLAVVSFATSAAAGRLGLKRLVQLLLAIGTGLMAFAFYAVRAGQPFAPMATYVIVEVLSSLLLVQGWSVTTEALDVRAAKRLLPLIGVAAGLAWTVGGLSVPELVKWVGAPSLLLAVCGLLVSTGVALEIIGRLDLASPDSPSSRDAEPRGSTSFWATATGSLRYIFSEPLMRVLAAIITLDLLVEQVTDFQLFSVAQESFHAAPARIAAFMGNFYAATGAITLVATLTFSGRVLARVGSTRSMTLAAFWVLCLSLAFLVSPTFPVIVLVTGGDRILKQSLSSPARTQIMGALPAVRRAQAGAVLRGVLGSAFAVVGASVLKLLQKEVPVRWLSVATALLAAALLAAILGFLRRGYVLALQRTVDKRRLDLDAPGEAQRSLDREQVVLLGEELRSADVDRVQFATSMLANGEISLVRPLLQEALGHPSAQAQTSAVQALSSFGQPSDAGAIVQTLQRSDDDQVRCACLIALAKLEAKGEMPAVARFCDAADPRVRALARACLARFDASQLDRFRSMLTSTDEAERAAAAWAVGRVQLTDEVLRGSFAHLLDDSSLAVRREAVGAAGWFADLPIVTGLVFALDEHTVAPAAFDAFSQLDDLGIQSVELALRDAPAAVISRTASALSRGAGDRSVDLLTTLLGHEDASVRHRAARSLMAQRRSRDDWHPDGPRLMSAILAELEQGYRYYATLIALAEPQPASVSDEARRFLGGEIRSRIRQTEDRLLALIAVASDRRVARLSGQLRDASPQTVARVIELLEQSIDAELARLVVPFIEAQTAEARSKEAHERFHVPPQYWSDAMAGIIDMNDEHLRRCALLAWRERMVAEYPAMADREQPLLHLVERIRFLRSVPLFKQLAPEDLMKLAEIADPVEYVAGHRIFKKGDPGEVLCVVVRGRVEIRDEGRVIASQGAHEFFGELAVLDHEARSADAVCAEDTELLQIGAPDLEELMDRRPEIAKEIIRVLARRLRQTTRAMLSLGPAAPAPLPPRAGNG
jgi:HEAT repeat protein